MEGQVTRHCARVCSQTLLLPLHFYVIYMKFYTGVMMIWDLFTEKKGIP